MDNLDLRVAGRYRLIRRLGGGGFGDLYEGVDLKTRREVALKLEFIKIDPSFLDYEALIYEKLAGGTGIPRAYWHGQECEYRVIVFDLLGPSLEDLFHFCGRRFSLKTVLLLADQLIRRFQYIHSKDFVHRDIKPENILMGRGRSGNQVYITDMGLAAGVRTTAENVNNSGTRRICLIGTALFTSIRGHLGVEQFPRDDMESLGYVLLYFLRGSLPWQGLETTPQQRTEESMLRKKETLSVSELCAGLPKQFTTYFNHLRSLRLNDKPNYSYLCGQFRNLFINEGYRYDFIFDWTELKFRMAPQGSHQASVD